MPVVKSTIVNWVKTTLGNAGIDKFTAHSTSGFPVHEVSKWGNWSRHATWQNH